MAPAGTADADRILHDALLPAARTMGRPRCGATGYGSLLDGNPHHHRVVALHEARLHALRLLQYLDHRETLQDFFPHDPELQRGKPHPDAAMNPKAEGDVLARPFAVDDELVGTVDRLLVAIARDVPHHHLVAVLDLLAANLDV